MSGQEWKYSQDGQPPLPPPDDQYQYQQHNMPPYPVPSTPAVAAPIAPAAASHAPGSPGPGYRAEYDPWHQYTSGYTWPAHTASPGYGAYPQHYGGYGYGYGYAPHGYHQGGGYPGWQDPYGGTHEGYQTSSYGYYGYGTEQQGAWPSAGEQGAATGDGRETLGGEGSASAFLHPSPAAWNQQEQQQQVPPPTALIPIVPPPPGGAPGGPSSAQAMRPTSLLPGPPTANQGVPLTPSVHTNTQSGQHQPQAHTASGSMPPPPSRSIPSTGSYPQHQQQYYGGMGHFGGRPGYPGQAGTGYQPRPPYTGGYGASRSAMPHPSTPAFPGAPRRELDPFTRQAISINKRITGTTSAKEIFDIVAHEHEAFDTICLATAIHRLASLKGAPNLNEEIVKAPEFFKLKDLILKARKEFGARNLANTLWSIAKLNHFPGDEFMQQLCKEVKEKVHQGNAQNVANLLWSLGVLQYNPGEDVLKALALTVRDKSRDFSGQNISNTVLAFAKLDYNPDEDVLAALAKETLNKLPSFSPQALSNTLWGLSKLEIKDEVLFTAIATEACSRAWDFNSQNLANSIWAFGNLCIHPGDDMMDKLAAWTVAKINEFTPQNLSNVVWSFAKLGVYHEALFTTAQAKSIQIMHTFQPQSISNFLWAFATLDHSPEPEFLHAAAVKGIQMLDLFSPQNLSNTCWALATLKDHEQILPYVRGDASMLSFNAAYGMPFSFASEPALFMALSGEIIRRLTVPNKEAEFSRQHLANYIWSLATLEVHPGPAAMQMITTSLRNRAPQCIPQEISNSVWACSKLMFTDALFFNTMAQETIDRIAEFSQQNLTNISWAFAKSSYYHEALMTVICSSVLPMLGELTVQHLSNLLWAFAKLKHDSPELINMVTHEFERFMGQEQLEPQQMSNFLWGLGVAGGLTPTIWSTAMEHLKQQEGWRGQKKEMQPETLSQFFQTYLMGLAQEGTVESDWPIMPELLQPARAAWEENAKIVTISEFHSEVSRTLSAMGVSHVNEKLTDDNLFSVDIALEGEHIAVEADGPFHFTINTLRPLGEMYVRKRLLEVRGWTVVSVPFFAWQGLSEEEKKRYLLRLLTQAKAGVPCHPTDHMRPPALASGPPRQAVRKEKEGVEDQVEVAPAPKRVKMTVSEEAEVQLGAGQGMRPASATAAACGVPAQGRSASPDLYLYPQKEGVHIPGIGQAVKPSSREGSPTGQ